MDLVSYLKADHDAIRKAIAPVRSLIHSDANLTEALLSDPLHELNILWTAHSKAEERTVYVHSTKLSSAELRDFALEGLEEHAIIEELISKIAAFQKADLSVERLRALCDMILLHLDQEEKDYFPLLGRNFSKAELDTAAVAYLQQKRSEQVRAEDRHRYIMENQNSPSL